jgi:hypothetical protein
MCGYDFREGQALEIPLPWRPAADRCGSARADPADERGKSAVGCAAHPWRVAPVDLSDEPNQERDADVALPAFGGVPLSFGL